jgi:uncharacterized protein YkwD
MSAGYPESGRSPPPVRVDIFVYLYSVAKPVVKSIIRKIKKATMRKINFIATCCKRVNRKKLRVRYGRNIKIEKEIFHRTNNERKSRNIPTLLWNDDLYRDAQRRSHEIIKNFSHQNVPLKCGENIAMMPIGNVRYFGFVTKHTVAKALMKTWMKSDGHRENILRGQFTSCCVGIAWSNRKYYGVQLFS